MPEPYLGEIRAFAFSYVVPNGWAACNGQILPISQNQALFSILGFTYGGDGLSTFALPDLRGRVPAHAGPGMPYGKVGGEERHTLTLNEIPVHRHQIFANAGNANSSRPAGRFWGKTGAASYAGAPDTAMDPLAISAAGSNEAHANMQPYTVLNYCIAMAGLFPPHN